MVVCTCTVHQEAVLIILDEESVLAFLPPLLLLPFSSSPSSHPLSSPCILLPSSPVSSSLSFPFNFLPSHVIALSPRNCLPPFLFPLLPLLLLSSPCFPSSFLLHLLLRSKHSWSPVDSSLDLIKGSLKSFSEASGSLWKHELQHC